RPQVWHGKEVPSVLLSGNHKMISDWRHEQAVKRTMEKRPDMLKKGE
ncbi:MAG: tRNA (guanosine(37)-N1)-methyltransferase TrmD, partial [Oscillospiraceae bacterium]|nr:tRNA (guanosine(37)-N1)-methyltransferase TrmD [Oscillospiraceae bacterium]